MPLTIAPGILNHVGVASNTFERDPHPVEANRPIGTLNGTLEAFLKADGSA